MQNSKVCKFEAKKLKMDVREVTRFKPDMMLKPAMVQEGRFSGNRSSSFYAFLKEKSHLVFTFSVFFL